MSTVSIRQKRKYLSGANKRKEREQRIERAADEIANHPKKINDCFTKSTQAAEEYYHFASQNTQKAASTLSETQEAEEVNNLVEAEKNQQPSEIYEAEEVSNLVQIEENQQPSEIECSENLENPESNENISSKLTLDLTDPANWPSIINDNFRNLIVKIGPSQVFKHPKGKFPTKQGRKFNKLYYKRNLQNGTTVNRTYLIYSLINDALICFCCKLFCNNHDSPFESNGYSDWKNVQRALSFHEKSNEHRICYMKWANLKDKLKHKLTGIDKMLHKEFENEKNRWKKFLKRFLDCFLFLARRNLAFRGSSDQIGNENNGNFLD